MPNPSVTEQMEAHRVKLLKQCSEPPQPESVSDLPVHITDWGGSGPVVFLVHGGVQGGLGGGPISFAGQQALSTRGWHLKLINRPGFGMSPSRGPDDMIADAHVVANQLSKNTHLIGHSFGGAVVLLAAGKRPNVVRSLILIEPALQPLLATDPKNLTNPDILSALQLVSKLMLTAQTPGEFASAFSRSLGEGVDGIPRPSATMSENNPQRAEILGCALLRARIASPVDMRQAADAVVRAGIPVLVVSGGYSRDQDAGGEALARMLHGQHVIVKSPNHFIQQSNPGDFNKIIETFLHEIDSWTP